jgi:signal transduction histidine kinase
MPNIHTRNIACPNCNQLTLIDFRFCPHCNADLAIAALIAERAIPTAQLLSERQRATPEMLVPRIGENLIKQGLLTEEQLQHALKVQAERVVAGNPILTGELLVELGFITRDNLDQTITHHVLQLQAALANSNQQLEYEVQTRTSQLQNALLKLTEINKLKRNFISNVSHELRMPMQFLVGYLDLLADGSLGNLSGDQEKAIGSLQNASQRLEHLIEDLILYSAAANGELPLELAPIKLGLPVHTAVIQSEPKAQARNVFLKKHLSPQIPEVIADNQKITWVVEQFLDNAIKFTPPGGKVKIDAVPIRGDVIVKVTDTGIGIPSDRINEIFEPFHQLDGSSTRQRGGTGLGLALARSIVEAHGSRIMVDSQPGEGSCFSFSLPAIR